MFLIPSLHADSAKRLINSAKSLARPKVPTRLPLLQAEQSIINKYVDNWTLEAIR
jgi:hypothetical protein